MYEIIQRATVITILGVCVYHAYLKQYYHEIPNKPLHLIVHNKVDRNLSIRFLRKKGSIFKVIVCIWIGKSIEGV